MRAPVGVKVGVFALVVMGGYSYFANSIPQIESKPPQELSLEGGTVTPAQLVKAGEELYHTKGTCEICHRIGQAGTRAPDLAGIGGRAATRKPGARSTGAIRWGTIAPRSQYVLILLAVTFTWLMGLMGFARSGIRQHWHVYGVLRDTSPEAVTPALGYAANVITVVTITFFALVTFIFWLGGLAEKGKAEGHGHAPAPVIAGASDSS